MNPLMLAPCVLLAVAAAAPAAEHASRENDSTLNLLLENDAVAGTDRNYTNGIELNWLSRAYGPQSDEGLGRRFGLALGHQLYTPDDITASQPLPGQRPYAAWAYAGFALVYDKGHSLDTWLLNVGIVGPDAEGESVQNDFHNKLGNSKIAQGWANQLPNEVAGQLVYEHKWRGIVQTRHEGLGFDVTPHAGFSLGNIATYANAGITLRFGNDLRNDFGVPRIRPALPGSAYFAPRDGFGWYLFAGVDGRAVAYNEFLDGTMFRDSLSVDRKPLVADLQAGAAVFLGRVRLSYTFVVRTEEYEGQPEPDKFGSVAVTVRF